MLLRSPAVMTDTKAAIRYLRYNSNLYATGKSDIFIGNTDYIFVTGTSGGGGLTAVIAATGNNSDYFQSLYEIGAAGISKVGNSYVSAAGIGDNVFGTVSYCPIIELAMSGSGYEWTYNNSRASRSASWANNGGDEETGTIPAYADNEVMQASAWYAENFVEYVNGLKLKDEKGRLLTATYQREESALAGTTGRSFKDAMQGLLEKGINKALAEWNDKDAMVDGTPISNATGMADLSQYSSWLFIDGKPAVDGIPAANSVAAISNLDTFLLDNITSLKHNVFTWAEHFNLYGAKESYQYSPYDQYYWEQKHDTYNDETFTTKGLGAGTYTTNREVGENNTGLTWAEYLKTADGQALALQMKMSTPIPYLVGSGKIPYLTASGAVSSDDSDIAPYWYVRHGINDSDAGFATETVLYYALLNCKEIERFNFNFSWNKPHSGSYDNLEAFDWIDECIAEGLDKAPAHDSSTAVTRAMAVTALYQLVGSPAVSGATPFTDLPQDLCANAIQWAVEAGVATGRSKTIFDPSAAVTREELVTFLYRYAQAMGKDVSASAKLDNYTDSASVSAYAVDAMEWAVSKGIILGVTSNTLAPSGTSSQATLTIVLARFDQNAA